MNQTYIQSMSGYYPATYGFENDKNGNNIFGWTITENSGATINVLSDIDGHTKVVEVKDIVGGASNWCRMTNGFTAQNTGTIEYWFRLDTGGGWITMSALYSGGNEA